MGKNINDNSDPQEGKENNFTGNTPIDERIQILTNSLKEAKDSFCRKNDNITNQIYSWSVICVAIVISTIYVFTCFFERVFDKDWSWQYIYYTAIRIAAISAIFYVLSFSFNMLKSSIELYQKNKTKLTIIDSMASFVESGIFPEDRKEILKKIIGIIVDSDFNNQEKTDEKYLKVESDILTELIKKIVEIKK